MESLLEYAKFMAEQDISGTDDKCVAIMAFVWIEKAKQALKEAEKNK